MIKAEEGPYWPRLLKDTKKVHWLKVDFNKWKDEDESDEEAAGAGPGGPGGGPGGDMDIEAVSHSAEWHAVNAYFFYIVLPSH